MKACLNNLSRGLIIAILCLATSQVLAEDRFGANASKYGIKNLTGLDDIVYFENGVVPVWRDPIRPYTLRLDASKDTERLLQNLERSLKVFYSELGVPTEEYDGTSNFLVLAASRGTQKVVDIFNEYYRRMANSFGGEPLTEDVVASRSSEKICIGVTFLNSDRDQIIGAVLLITGEYEAPVDEAVCIGTSLAGAIGIQVETTVENENQLETARVFFAPSPTPEGYEVFEIPYELKAIFHEAYKGYRAPVRLVDVLENLTKEDDFFRLMLTAMRKTDSLQHEQ
ncbi:MAG: hypothetical protein QNJ84_06230 [Alphaproteobacteria bacterium]|nr:hypothetical protein [Alphaproteobacteria bacterium]